MSEPTWAEKLAPLVQRDLSLRQVLLEKGSLNDTYHPEMEKLHIENAGKLKRLIEKRGFPVLSSAGEEGVRLAWLIIQHSISLPDFMRECLQEMRLAASQQDWPLELLAYTEDRIAFFEGRPQLYGTNRDWKDGELRITQVEDPARLDLRRRSLGLPPISEAMDLPGQERPPKDGPKKEKEFKAFLARVGWHS